LNGVGELPVIHSTKAKLVGEFEMGRKGFGWNERMTLSRQIGAGAQHRRVFSKTGKVRARAKPVRAYFVLFMRWAAHQNDSLAFRNTHVALNHTACTEEERWVLENIIQTNVHASGFSTVRVREKRRDLSAIFMIRVESRRSSKL
jgi:hypothetical protein